MIICVCNNLNEQEIQTAISGGCKTASEVWEFHKCRGRCTKCVPEIEESIENEKDRT
jgi:bacterioferritin-associated ferredoxin